MGTVDFEVEDLAGRDIWVQTPNFGRSLIRERELWITSEQPTILRGLPTSPFLDSFRIADTRPAADPAHQRKQGLLHQHASEVSESRTPPY